MSIRVKVRLGKEDNGQTRKIVRFDPTEIELSELIDKIATKLGVPATSHQQSKQDLRLMLGLAILEDTDEIDNGDELALVVVNTDKKNKPHRATNQERTTIGGATDEDDGDDDDADEDVSKIKKEKTSEKDDNESPNSSATEAEDDESYIEDVTDEVLKQRKKLQVEGAVHLDEGDDDDSSGSDGEDSWSSSDSEEEVSSEEDSDEDSFQDDVTEDEKLDVKPKPKPQLDRKRKSVGNTTSRSSVGNKKRRSKAKAPPEPPLEVIMEQKDIPNAPGTSPQNTEDGGNDKSTMEQVSCLASSGGNGNRQADQKVKDRIIKLLNTGFHENSNENEAKNAMKLAQRLMRKYDLSQAMLLQEREDRNNNMEGSQEEVLKGGLVRVRIVNRKTRKPAQMARWISYLSIPISKNFGVESFYSASRGRSCSMTFYGVYTNAQLAAYAFKIATERISQMSAQYVPSIFSNVSTRSSRLSYALGIVHGISKEVDETLQREKEEKQRKLEKARRAVSKGEAYEESDDDDYDDGDETGGYSFPGNSDPADENSTHNHDGEPTSGGDKSSSDTVNAAHLPSDSTGDQETSDSNKQSDGVARIPPPASTEADTGTKPSSSSLNINQERLDRMEKEEQAALVLIDHREKVAEKVLNDNGIKVSKGRKRSAICFDSSSYRKGVEDSKEIDINQRAIRDEIHVKKEPKVEP